MNLLELVRGDGQEPVHIGSKNGGEWHCKCPECGGNEDRAGVSHRFCVWPEQGENGTWWCRGCDCGGDALEYLRKFRGLSFRDACKLLGRELAPYQRGAKPKLPSARRFEPKLSESPAMLWRRKMAALVETWADALQNCPEALEYLDRRGIPAEAARHFRIGWNDRTQYRGRVAYGLPEEIRNGAPRRLWLPKGLVVPAFQGGELQQVRIRRTEEDRKEFCAELKYVAIPGSNFAPILTNERAEAFVVIEAALDSYAVDWACRDLNVGAVALHTLTGKPSAQSVPVLRDAAVLLNALDFEPGEPEPGADAEKIQRMKLRALDWWQREFSQCVRWPVPDGKDPGEYFERGGDLRAWVLSGLPPVFRLRSRCPAAPEPVAAPEPAVIQSDLIRVPESIMRLRSELQHGGYLIVSGESIIQSRGVDASALVELIDSRTIREWLAQIPVGPDGLKMVTEKNVLFPLGGMR